MVGEVGFDAITVALLGRSTPFGTLFAGILFGGLKAGGLAMQASTGTPIDIVLVLQSLIVLFIAAPALVRTVFRLKAATGEGLSLSTGVERMSTTTAPTTTAPPPAAEPEPPSIAPRSRRGLIIMTVLSVGLTALFTWLASPDQTTTFTFDLGDQFLTLPD